MKRSLKIKISGLITKAKPQIEWGPYESDDLIARAIINILTPDYLIVLHNVGRVTLLSENADVREYEYFYS